MFRTILVSAAAAMIAVLVATPAGADPWVDDQVDDYFASQLEERGFNVSHDLQSTRQLGAYARNFCRAVDNGVPYETLIATLRQDNPTFTDVQTTVFGAITIRTYCPPTPNA